MLQMSRMRVVAFRPFAVPFGVVMSFGFTVTVTFSSMMSEKRIMSNCDRPSG